MTLAEMIAAALGRTDDDKGNRFILTGRAAVRARKRRYGEHRPERSRCTRQRRRQRTGGVK